MKEDLPRVTRSVVQADAGARVEEFLYEKLDRKVPSRVTNGELLAQYMAEAASELGPTTPYGKTLIKVAEAEKRLGAAERDFIHTASINFLTPLRTFLEGDWKTISKERRLLHNRRLDLDACKARLKKAKAAEAKATVGVLLASCPPPALVGAKEGVKEPGVWRDFSPLSLPGEAWLVAAALLTTSGYASLPHLQWTPGGPEPWDPGQTLMGWADQQCPDLGSGQPAASPDRQPAGFLHAPALPSLGARLCSRLCPDMAPPTNSPTCCSSAGPRVPCAQAPLWWYGGPQSWTAYLPRGMSEGPFGSPTALDRAWAVLAPPSLSAHGGLSSQADGTQCGTL
eukprot:bmy_08597T0